jgi:hypothetical protein
MKKIVLMMALAMYVLTASATGYAYLLFTNTAGTTTAMNVTGLTMTVSGTQLQVTNNTENLSFVLTDLASMQFSKTDTLTAVENVLAADKPVEVYSVIGVKLGSYESLLKAVCGQKKGVYVITDGTNSQKIVVK